MQAWLKTTLAKLSQKSDVAAAILYALGRWSALVLYCEDGRVEPCRQEASGSISHLRDPAKRRTASWRVGEAWAARSRRARGGEDLAVPG